MRMRKTDEDAEILTYVAYCRMQKTHDYLFDTVADFTMPIWQDTSSYTLPGGVDWTWLDGAWCEFMVLSTHYVRTYFCDSTGDGAIDGYCRLKYSWISISGSNVVIDRSDLPADVTSIGTIYIERRLVIKDNLFLPNDSDNYKTGPHTDMYTGTLTLAQCSYSGADAADPIFHYGGAYTNELIFVKSSTSGSYSGEIAI